MTDVSLEDALGKLRAVSGIPVSFDPSVLPERRRVSVQGVNITLDSAYHQVLFGTGYAIQQLSDGRLFIAPSAKVGQTQATGVIVGKIVHAKTKQPIAGAMVVVDNEKTSVRTAEDGSFRLAVPAGEHTIIVRGVGFTRQARHVVIVEGKTLSVEVALEPSASVLDEVVVTGTVVATARKALATPITVITAADIERRGITSIEEFFRGEVPGVVALELGSQRYSGGGESSAAVGAMATATVYARGTSTLSGDANPLKAYVDGVEMLDPSYLGTLDLNSIERIEIIAGPQAATIYGSGAMGGVMQIFTKKGSGRASPDITFRGRYGFLETNVSQSRTPSHNHALTMSGGLGPSLSYSGTASYDYTGQWQPGLFSRNIGGSAGVTMSGKSLTWSGSVSLREGRNGAAADGGAAVYDYPRIQSGEYSISQFVSPAYYTSHRISTSSNQSGSLNITYRIGGIWQHDLTLGRTYTSFNTIPEHPQFWRPADSVYIRASATGNRTTMNYYTTVRVPRIAFLSNVGTIGVNGSSGAQTKIDGGAVDPKGVNYAWTRISTPIDDRSWGGFLNWQLGAFDQLFFTLGVRGELNKNYGREHKQDWTPKIGLAWAWEVGDATIKLLGSYGRTTRPPTAQMRGTVIANFVGYEPSTWVRQVENVLLRPERTKGQQGGFEVYYGNRFSITVNRYQQTVIDLIQGIPVDSAVLLRCGTLACVESVWPVLQNQNTATMHQDGWEGTGGVTVSDFTVKATYSWSQSRIKHLAPKFARLDGGVDANVREGATFPGIPTHTGNLIVSRVRGKSSITLSTNYMGKTFTSGANKYFYNTDRQRLRMYVGGYIRKSTIDEKPGYFKSDLSSSYNISSSVSLLLNISNLGNSYGSDVQFFYPSLGRKTFLGATWRLTPRK